MNFDEVRFDKPVLILANGKSLQEATDAELEEAAKKCTVIAINGAGRIKPDIRFFLDGKCHLDKAPDLQAAFDREPTSELYAGRPSLWDEGFFDYEVQDYMTPWNNSFLACMWVVLNNNPDVNVYVIGGDCNPEYSDDVIWSPDYKTITGKIQAHRGHIEHMERMLGSSKNEIGEILVKFPGRLFSLCGKHNNTGIPECQWSDIK